MDTTSLAEEGYGHIVLPSHELKLVHLVASLLKRWILGTYQGAVRPSHLVYYLDESTFRFNRRTSASRGKLFYRLVQQAMMVDPAAESALKGAAMPFLEGEEYLNLDQLDDNLDHNINSAGWSKVHTPEIFFLQTCFFVYLNGFIC